ncbi:unnamed protein product, partial [Iphiclides podalirius]
MTCMFQICYGDWVSEWMTPIRDQYSSKGTSGRQYNKMDTKILDSERAKIPMGKEMFEVPKNNLLILSSPNTTPSQYSSLKVKLETVLHNAKELAVSLKSQITVVEERERALKEAIVEGRYGVTTLTVSTLRRLPRKYIIRDGFWTLCNGIVQHPPSSQDANAAVFGDLYSVPRCVGQEVASKPDQCVFNSVIKYDTVPTTRDLEYSEGEYLCLKPGFNNTLEQYYSVTKKLVDRTCKNGVIKSLDDNISECGLRVLSEYTFYPNKNAGASYLPLEYCEEKQGACKLIVAWQISNSTIENFEYIKDDPNFKSYFIKSGSFVNTVIY